MGRALSQWGGLDGGTCAAEIGGEIDPWTQNGGEDPCAPEHPQA